MDCKHIADKVWLYVEGDLKPREQQSVARHIASCRKCAGLVRDVTDSQLWLKSSEAERFDDAAVENLRRAARLKIAKTEQARRGRLGFFARVNWKPLILACPVMLVMCWLAVYRAFDKKRDSTAPDQVADSRGYSSGNMQDRTNVSGTDSGTGTASGTGTRPEAGSRQRGSWRHKRPTARPTGLKPSEFEVRGRLAIIRETSQTAPLRIEIQTEDPNVRIIWFTSPGDGPVLSGPDR